MTTKSRSLFLLRDGTMQRGACGKRALAIDAETVIRVSCESAVGWTTWGYMDAKWTGVKLGD